LHIIQQQFNQLAPLTDTEWQFFADRLEAVEFPKQAIISAAGHTEQYLYFLEQGLVRIFTEQAEREITFDFAFGGDFFSAYSSFLTRTPADFSIQTLAPSLTYRIHYDQLQEVYQTSPGGQAIGRQFAEKLFIRKARRELELLRTSAEQRYLKLLQEQPMYLQHIPLKYLASFLGITPQALSRIRKRIS
jgi:CRP-like cAMP-binding protein